MITLPLSRSFAFPSFLCLHRDAYFFHMHSRHSGPARISFCCFSFHSGPVRMLPGPVRMLPCFRDDPDIPTRRPLKIAVRSNNISLNKSRAGAAVRLRISHQVRLCFSERSGNAKLENTQ